MLRIQVRLNCSDFYNNRRVALKVVFADLHPPSRNADKLHMGKKQLRNLTTSALLACLVSACGDHHAATQASAPATASESAPSAPTVSKEDEAATAILSADDRALIDKSNMK